MNSAHTLQLKCSFNVLKFIFRKLLTNRIYTLKCMRVIIDL